MDLEARSVDSICPPLRRFLGPNSTILDVGCGPGVIALDVARIIEAGSVVGVDWSSDRIENASVRASGLGVRNVKFQQADALALTFEDRSFDLVYSTHMLEHISDPVLALREMQRVAKPNGSVICSALDSSTATFYPPCPSMEAIYRGWAQLPTLSNYDKADPGLGRRLFSLAIEANLRAVEIELFGIPAFMATATQPDSIQRVFVQAKHHARREHKRLSALIEEGILSSDVSERAHRELDAWHSHPGAFFSQGIGVLVSGKA